MNRLLSALLVPLLFSCTPKKIEIPMMEVPSGQLVQALTDRAHSFQSLRALASITVARKGRKRSFESVAVLVAGRDRFKLEAYSPLGQTIATVLWGGGDVFVEMNGEQRQLPPQSAVLERILGAEVLPADLCALLSGNIPGIPGGGHAKMRCAPNNSCVLEQREGEREIRVYPAMGWESGSSSLPVFEVYQGTTLVYRVRYGSFEASAGYDLPRLIIVESPGKQMTLTVIYAEAEVNLPLDASLFDMPASGGAER